MVMELLAQYHHECFPSAFNSRDVKRKIVSLYTRKRSYCPDWQVMAIPFLKELNVLLR